jgi:uncharacterized membrane protein YeaQ/YmgE (transglycosylase-associated protein family)
MLISIIGWLIIGLIVGAIARFLVPGRDPMGCLATSLLGIGGSFVGGLIGRALWSTHREGYYHPGFLISIVGAVILLLLWRMIRRS